MGNRRHHGNESHERDGLETISFQLCFARTESFSLRSLQKLVGELCFWGGGKFCGKFGGNLVGFFGPTGPTKQRLKIIGGRFRIIFRKRIRASKQMFCANFVLQTCSRKKASSNYTVKPAPPSNARPMRARQVVTVQPYFVGARPRGCTTTHPSKKGS